MKIYQIFTKSALRNFTYLLTWQSKAICIDPFDAGQVKRILQDRGLQLEAIINTHEHWDHHCGNRELQDELKAPVWAHERAAKAIPGVERFLREGEKIPLQENQGEFLQVMDIPGHTMAHIGLLLHQQGRPTAFFSGDTFFNAGVGNCKAGGDPRVLFRTVEKRIKTLDGTITIYPGHEYMEKNLLFALELEKGNPWAEELLQRHRQRAEGDRPSVGGVGDEINAFPVTDMDWERKINVFLRLKEGTIRERIWEKNQREFLPGHMASPEDMPDEEVFLALRRWRDIW